MKEFLSQQNLEFEVLDVHTDPKAQEDMVTMGMFSIPVTIIGENAPIVGFDRRQIESALAS